MMRRHVLLAVLLLAAAFPAAAQDSIPHRWGPLAGIAWGLPEDSVIALLGPPTNRWQEGSYDNLEYADSSDGRPLTRFVVLLPEVGSAIAGFELPFEDDDCVVPLGAIRADVERAFPRLEWEGAPPEPDDCVRVPARAWINGTDAASGTRVSIRMDFDRMLLSVNATSRLALEYVGVTP
jgi:hypothetical protein